MENISLGKFISNRRKELKISQKDLADILNVAIPTISKWENDDRLPDLAIIGQIAKALKVDLESLLKCENALNNNYDIQYSFDINRFAKHFNYLRKYNNLSLVQLADIIKARYQAISKWENEESLPNIHMLVKCANVFKVSIAELYYGISFNENKEKEIISKKKTNYLPIFISLLSIVFISILLIIFLKPNNGNTSDSNLISSSFEDVSDSTSLNESSDSSISDNPENSYNIYYYDENNNLIEKVVAFYDDHFKLKDSYNVENKEVVCWYNDEFSFSPNSTITYSYTHDLILYAKLDYALNDSNYEYTFIDETSVAIDKYNGNNAEIVIYPYAKIDNLYYQIASIGPSAFEGNSIINSVVIANTIPTIHGYAFANCENLKEFILPEKLSFLGDHVFEGCESLEEITIPEGVTDIWAFCFSSCSYLEKIYLPSTLLSINEGAFLYCPMYEVYYNGTIDDWCNIEKANSYIFNETTSFFTKENGEYKEVKKEVIINNASIIKDYSFYNLSTITSLNINSNIASIGKYAFYNCKNLYNVNLPNTLKTIYDNAFAECALLYEVLLPESLEKIKFAAFNNCRNLSSIVLPNNLTHIEEIAFGNCNKLNTIIIPESVIYIKSGAFAECFDVKFYCKVNEQPSKWADDWNDSNSPIIWGYKG